MEKHTSVQMCSRFSSVSALFSVGEVKNVSVHTFCCVILETVLGLKTSLETLVGLGHDDLKWLV